MFDRLRHKTTQLQTLFFLIFLIFFAAPAFAAKDYNIKNDTQSWLFIKGSTGKVGLGTTNPQANLEVGTATTIPDGSAPVVAVKGNFVVDGNIYGNGPVTFSGSGNSYFNGNLGIGVSSPSQALVVVGTVQATTFSGSFSVDSASDKQVQYNNSGVISNATSLIYDQASGNVGINSASPTARLNVVGTTIINGTVEINLQ